MSKFVMDILVVFVEVIEAADSPDVGRTRVVVIVDEATYDGQLSLCLTVVKMGLGTKDLVDDGNSGFFLSANDTFLWWGTFEQNWFGTRNIISGSRGLMGGCHSEVIPIGMTLFST